MNNSLIVDNSIEAFLDIKDDTKEIIEESIDNGLHVDRKDIRKIEDHPLVWKITDDDRRLAVSKALIPEALKNSTFDAERIKANLVQQHNREGGMYVIRGFNKYIEACCGILSAIRTRQLPALSYLIGAPNGFGKTSFVVEGIITALKQGYTTAPYISLWELSQIRVDNELKMMNPYRRYKDETGTIYTDTNMPENPNYKNPEIVTGRFSYSEYVNADILFVRFTDVISKDIESHTLYQLLSIRGPKGLPTIATMSTSLEPYLNDKKLKELVWDEILAYKEDKNNYDRIYHVSTYKRRTTGSLELKTIEFDKETGVID